MKYVRTKDGRIADIEKFINEEKDTPYYKDFIFEEITKDGVLNWTAVGTDKNTIEGQKGRRCRFGATLNSKVIKQADTIEELCDCYILVGNNRHIPCNKLSYEYYQTLAMAYELEDFVVYGAIWTDKGLIYVAKMNDKGELELLWTRN